MRHAEVAVGGIARDAALKHRRKAVQQSPTCAVDGAVQLPVGHVGRARFGDEGSRTAPRSYPERYGR